MFHFVYKTVNSKGDYYIGRHSTKKLTDNYQGSGNWIKHSKNKNSHLITGIIDFSYSFDTVKILEESIIYYHLKVLKDKKCKNQSLSSSGFSVGDLNPANRPEQRERSRKNAWFSTEAGKEWIKNNHSTDNPENKKLFSENAKKQWENEEYKSYMRKCVSIANAKPENKKRMIENNPAKTEQARKKISISSTITQRKRIDEGTHHFLSEKGRKQSSINGKNLMCSDRNPAKNPESVAKRLTPTECPHCHKIGGKSQMTRYHFDNCKLRPRKYVLRNSIVPKPNTNYKLNYINKL